jgi:hypothetical protein
VFAANRVVLVPAGIGTRPPLRRFAGRIADAHCYGALATIEPTGVVLVRPGAVRLLRHAEIVLEVGPPVPPHAVYTFPPGT